MTPQTARALLHAYIDGELDPASTLELRDQIENSPALQQELARLTALQKVLQNHATRYRSPVGLADRVLAGDAVTDRSKFWPAPASRWPALALGSTLTGVALLLWSLGLFVQQKESAVSLEEIVGAHVRSLMVDHLTDFASSERHSVKPWLATRLDFAPPVLDLPEEGYNLVGARLDYVGGKPAAAIVYRQRQHIINVFVWPSASTDSKPLRASVQRGFNCATFENGGMTYWIISDLNAVDLRRLAERLQQVSADAPSSG